MMINKLTFTAMLFLLNCIASIGQDFKSDLEKCINQLASSDNLQLEVDIKALHPESMQVLESSQIVLQKKGNITYQEMMEEETILDQDLQLALKVNHDFKVVSIHKTSGTSESLLSNVSNMLSEMTKLYTKIERSDETDDQIVKYTLIKEDQVVSEIVINNHSNRLISLSKYDTKRIETEGEVIVPVLSMRYNYKVNDKIPVISNFISVDDQYKLKEKYKKYKVYNLLENQ